ncbi:methionine biosynthesis protein MetW [Alkalilimnicola ehrlichii]|uniref:Methionine biosynthesis protein MetW n=1 Tax=Alkalilimnicola ehrlichii TaxID=351052 RepID=A0A3E0X1V5_9GAMM|nr:methionine biosynthesis protein MetW [Alkalilimnicola ehrlichii]RFA31482.1 methionine biosynthesis protein MetW [Alkalilimnicola ehrlichii]RFA39643.1 methionine biosynthesis protein MetW [Alkalilimnicola ehrlichii]
MRPDLEIISRWIAPRSRVLDLGCGDGTLLRHLQETREVSGYGLEIDPDNIVSCVKNRVNVIQTNLDRGLSDFDEDSFDYVVMSQTLQAVNYPDRLLDEMLRVGREGIVTFPNFAHWRLRFHLTVKGRMPMSGALPHSWYNTPNIHLCTIRDFEALCESKGIRILQRMVLDHTHRRRWPSRLLPNLMGEIAMYRFRRR